MGMEAAVLLAVERKSLLLEVWSLAWFDIGKLRVLS